MNKLTKQQIKKANIFLKMLCESKSLDNNKVDSFFDDSEDAQYVCKTLELKNLLNGNYKSLGAIIYPR